MSNHGYKVSDLLLEMLIDKYDIIVLRIGDSSLKQEAMFFDGNYYRIWFDPLHSRNGGLEGSVYKVDKFGRPIITTYRSDIHSDEDVEKMFESINAKKK